MEGKLIRLVSIQQNFLLERSNHFTVAVLNAVCIRVGYFVEVYPLGTDLPEESPFLLGAICCFYLPQGFLGPAMVVPFYFEYLR
jgi:hypothetical protein